MLEKKLDSEILISSILRIGVYLSGTVILIGLIMFFITGNSGYPLNAFPTSIAETIRGSFEYKPAAIISFGLFLLIATPIFRVASSVILFLTEKDYLYTAITLFVFVTLIISIIFGKSI